MIGAITLVRGNFLRVELSSLLSHEETIIPVQSTSVGPFVKPSFRSRAQVIGLPYAAGPNFSSHLVLY
jgi:hypothetical protein